MRKHIPLIDWPVRDSKRYRFSIPNEVWDQKLRPIEFTIFSYLCYHQSHNPPVQITLQMIANSVHSTEITVKKYIESLIDKELIADGWLLAPSLQYNGCKNFFTLPNEIFLLKLPPSAFMVLAGILGHTKASFTLDTYTHTTGDMQKRAADIVGGFLTDYLGEEMAPWQNAENAATAASV